VLQLLALQLHTADPAVPLDRAATRELLAALFAQPADEVPGADLEVCAWWSVRGPHCGGNLCWNGPVLWEARQTLLPVLSP